MKNSDPLSDRYEIVIIGGGIAGASLAYFLALRGAGPVLLVEREEQLGYHATGRSAAVAFELDPNPIVQSLKMLGARFLREQPGGFCDHSILTCSGVAELFASRARIERGVFQLEASGAEVIWLSPGEMAERVPVLLPSAFSGAVLLPGDGHIDVHALLSSYVGGARRRGAAVRCRAAVTGLLRQRSGGFRVELDDGRVVISNTVVNAAGAWAGSLASMADASPIPLTPCRRTAVVFESPGKIDVAGWPMIASDDHEVYFVPESGGVLMSPMDKTPTAAGDARPDDLAIAAGMERLAALAPSLVPQALRRKWAGLRTFSPDGIPVVGVDPRCPGFFWLAGQAGYGIESSPALGRIAADLLLDGATTAFDAALLSPARFG